MSSCGPTTFVRWLPIAVLAAATACDAPPLPMDQGVPWELAEHRANTLRQVRYRIELTIPTEVSEPIVGRSLISFAWDDPDGQPVVLDFLEPGQRVHEVKVNGEESAWEPVNDHIVIPSDGMRVGLNEIDIRFDAGDEAFNRSDDFLYALFVPDRAHFSLPVFDQPNLKAAVRWTVTAPPGWEVVANGPSGDQSSYPDRTVHNFLETRPIPTYLMAVAAGRFEVETEVVGERVMRMYHRETDTEKVARNRDEIFRLHGAALDWLEEYTGIDYPFQKFDFVLIPAFQYGGMEHPGGILYRQAGLMLDETATQGQMLGRASVIAHETAHMWFGDLVTMTWFDDVWTKEVFANFMAAKIVHPSFPEVDHDLRFLTAHHPSAYGVDRTEGPNPIRQPLDNLRFAGTLYGAIIYQKAPIVMKQLEARVGEEAFRDGLREYLERFAYGNATWPDLIEILDAPSPDDLTAWSRAWVEEPGRPRIEVSRDGNEAILTPVDPGGRARIWPQRLAVRVGDIADSRSVDVDVAGVPVRLEGAGDAAFILPNGTGVEYADFVLDPRSQAYLLANASALEPPVLRGAAWVTLWDQVLDGRLGPAAFMVDAMAAIGSETNELILSRLLGYVSTTFWSFSTEAERTALAPELEALLWAGATGDGARSARSSFLSTYRGIATTQDGVARLRGLWSKAVEVPGLPLSESDFTALARALAVRGVPDSESILDQQGERITNPDRRARFDFARPALSGDPAVRRAFFDSLSEEDNRAREPWVLDGLGSLHHPLRAEASRELIAPALGLLSEIQRTGDIFFPGRWLDATLGGHSSPEAAAIVRTFLESNPDLSPRLRLKVLQSADMLFRASRIGETP